MTGIPDGTRADGAPAREWIRRHPAVAAGAAVLIALLIVLVMRGGRHTRSAAPASGGTQGMAGMQGMRRGGDDGAVHLSASQVTTFGVTFGTVEQRTLTEDVRTVGTVVVDEARTATVTPKFNGFVEQLYVNTTGQPVRRGEPLAAVFSPDLLAAEEELLLARRLDRTVGQSAVPGVPSSSAELITAAKRRLRLWDVSEAQIEEILRTGKTMRTVTLYSPVSGVVTDKKVTEGQAIQTGMELYSVTDLSEVWLDVPLRETDASNVRVGSGADIEFATYPGRPYKGRVTFIYPMVAEQSRTVRARVTVANPDGRLKPGMYATVHISSPTRVALTVPRSAVVQTGERNIVFVDRGQGALMPVDIEIGRAAGEYIEVLSGLEAGQRVVTSAQFLIDSESNLGEVMRSMIGTGGAPGMSNSSDLQGADAGGMQMKGADTRGMPGASAAPAPARGVVPPKAPR